MAYSEEVHQYVNEQLSEFKEFTCKNQCPYCGADLVGKASMFEKRSNHTWQAAQLDMNCSAEPDIESDDWQEWFKKHSVMPYVYWHPVVSDILTHIQLYYSFKI